MIKEFKQNNGQAHFWKAIMIIAAVFSFAVCILLIANYFQINRADPVNTTVINSLVERLNQNPGDQSLRNEIREFDLLARKAYFTNQWQIRFGGYLFLAGVILFIISLLMLDSLTKKVEPVAFPLENKLVSTQKNARKWISIGGVILVVITLAAAFLTHKEIGNKFAQKAILADKLNRSDSVQFSSNSEEKSDTTKQLSVPLISDTSKATVINSIEYPTAAMKSNFPSFRGPGGNGIAYQKNIPESWDGTSGKNIKWKTAIPLAGYNSPVVWGNKIFLTGADVSKQEVYCFDKNSGTIIWTAAVKGIKGSPDKSPKVTENTGYSAPSVTTDGEKVFAVFANGDILALDMKGKNVWSRNLGVPDNHYGYSSSLVVFEDKLIVQYDQRSSATILALSTKTGNTIWSTPRKVRISWSSPVIVNTGLRIEILLIADPCVASYDPSTGKELWKINCTSGEVGPSVAYANGIVFGVNEYAKLAAIQIGDKPKILWENNDYLSDVPSPVATDKYLIMATSYGEVACYNPKTGDLYWHHDFGTGSYSSPILVGEKVYLMDKKGVMHIFKTDKTFNLIGEPALGENTDCTPAFADGKIFIRAGNNLYCIGK